MIVVPNLNSRLIKFWTPEYSFGSRFRPMAALGFGERDVSHYDYHPRSRDHKAVENRKYKKHIGQELPSWMLAHVPIIDSAPTRGADFLAILNPDGWQYGKYDPEDLSEDFRSKRMFKVPKELNEERYSWVIKKNRVIEGDKLKDMLRMNGSADWLAIKYVPPALYHVGLH